MNDGKTLRLIGLHGRKRAGKDSTGLAIEQHLFGQTLHVGRWAFADPIRKGLETMLGVRITEQTDREAPLFAGHSYRYLAQTLGTEWGRSRVATDVWVQVMHLNLEQFFDSRFEALAVITDVRMPNEADMIHALGGEIWQVVNPRQPPNTDPHVSEVPLPDELIDRLVLNDGTLDDLCVRVGGLLDSIDLDGRPHRT